MDDLHRHIFETGHADLRPTHCLNVFRLMDCDGACPSPGAVTAKASAP